MVWEALRQVLGDPFKNTLVLFNDARAKRSSAFYDHADVTSDAEYGEIFDEAEKFVNFVRNKIKKDFFEFGKNI